MPTGSESFTRARVAARILALLLVVAFGAGMAHPTSASSVARATALAAYRIDAVLDVDAGRVSARQSVQFRNRTGVPLDSVVFRAVANALGGFSLESATLDGVAARAWLDGSVLEVPLAAPLAPGATAELGLAYTIRLPREASRLAATPKAIALGNWFPILAVHRAEWDRRQYVDVGDAFYTEVADYDVTVTTSRPTVLAGTGQLVEQEGAHWRFRAESVRDFALVASPSYAVQTVSTDGITVSGYAFSPSRARLYAERGAELVRWYGARLGAYPYPSLAIIDADLPASYGGMEYPGLVMLSAQFGAPSPFEGSALDVLLAHEIAHQWFYGWVGNDQIADPWLDEALATYLPVLFYAETRPDLYQAVLNRSVLNGADRAGAAAVDSTVYDFPADGPYFTVVYRKGARFLHALRGRLGDAAFFALLREYVATYRDRLARPLTFLDLAQGASPTDLNPLIAEFFSYPAYRYPTSQAWMLEAPAIPWQGSATLFVGADFPVTRVELWLDGYLLAAGPENAVTIDLSGVEPGEYVLLARVWNHDGVVFERGRRVEVSSE